MPNRSTENSQHPVHWRTLQTDSIPPYILRKMKAQGISSIRSLANTCGTTEGCLRHAFRGGAMRLEIAAKLAWALGVSLDDLARYGELIK